MVQPGPSLGTRTVAARLGLTDENAVRAVLHAVMREALAELATQFAD